MVSLEEDLRHVLNGSTWTSLSGDEVLPLTIDDYYGRIKGLLTVMGNRSELFTLKIMEVVQYTMPHPMSAVLAIPLVSILSPSETDLALRMNHFIHDYFRHIQESAHRRSPPSTQTTTSGSFTYAEHKLGSVRSYRK